MGSKALYSTGEWRRVRPIVLHRDGYRCRLRCSRRCRGVANSVDHILDPEDGGAMFDPANLQAACTPCNVAKRNRRVAARARRARGEVRQW